MELSIIYMFSISSGIALAILLFMCLYGVYLFYALFTGISCYSILIKLLFIELLLPNDLIKLIPNQYLNQSLLIFDSVYTRDLTYSASSILIYITYSLFIAKLVELPLQSKLYYWLRCLLIAYLGIAFIFIIRLSVGFLQFNLNHEEHRILSYWGSNEGLIAMSYFWITSVLICFLLLVVWQSSSQLKAILMGMLTFILLTFHGPPIYYSWHLRTSAAEQIMGVDSKKSFQVDRPRQVEIIDVLFRLGIAIQGFFFALALNKSSRLIEQENTTIREQYTLQLEQELARRTEQVREQEKLLEEQRFIQLKTDFEHKQAETEMAALRAQMNPHFIFNCLNSIKLYAVNNDPTKASYYLTKFSKLIRLVLENSRSSKITLDNELEALRLYLEMEAMRFLNKVKFNIEVDPSVETEFVEVPPLLIQPYVENAIWHGLMHKPEGGTVWVKINQYNEDQLQITIKDDGIGRVKAADLKSKSANKGKSFGMKLTSERLALINQLYKSDTQVQILDLIDAEGEPAGTEVLLQIPI